MRVAKIMTARPRTLSPEDGLGKVAQVMDEHDVRHLAVLDHGRLVGVITERDVLEATGWDPARQLECAEGRAKAVRDFMSVGVVTARPDEELADACARLVKRRIGCLPVVEDGALAGMLTVWDVLHELVRSWRAGEAPEAGDPAVETVMSTELVTIDHQRTVAEALALCRSEEVRHLPVLGEGWFVGLVSDRDLRLRAGLGRAETDRVGAVMATDVVAVRPGARLSEAAELMLLHKFGALAVTSAERRWLGVLTTADVLRHWAEHGPRSAGREGALRAADRD